MGEKFQQWLLVCAVAIALATMCWPAIRGQIFVNRHGGALSGCECGETLGRYERVGSTVRVRCLRCGRITETRRDLTPTE